MKTATEPVPIETWKRCYRCGQDRALTDFVAKKNGQTYDMCSPCLHEILTNGGQRGKRSVSGPKEYEVYTPAKAP